MRFRGRSLAYFWEGIEMNKGVKLESKFINAIECTLNTDEDVKAAKKYFENCLINDLIDKALKD